MLITAGFPARTATHPHLLAPAVKINGHHMARLCSGDLFYLHRRDTTPTSVKGRVPKGLKFRAVTSLYNHGLLLGSRIEQFHFHFLSREKNSGQTHTACLVTG
jgi:hypothetical protein